MPQVEPFGASRGEHALNLRLGPICSARRKIADAAARGARFEGQWQVAQALGKSWSAVGFTVIAMDEHRPGGVEGLAPTLRPEREQQAAIHAGLEGPQAATTGSRARGDFLVRGMSVPRRSARSPHFVCDFLRHSANDEFHGGSLGCGGATLRKFRSSRDPELAV